MADDLGRQLADLLYGSEPTPESPQDQRRIAQLIDRERLRRLTGAAEVAGTLGSGLLSAIPAGYAALGTLMPTRAGSQGDLRQAAQRVQDVQGALTYLPRTETGQQYLEKTVGALEPLSVPAKYAGDIAQKYTGSPVVGGVAETLADPINLVGTGIPTKMAKAGVQAAKAAPRVAGEVLSSALAGPPAGSLRAQRGAINLGSQIPEFQPQASAGLVSRVDEALASLPRQKGMGTEFLRELQKIPGVKPVELEDRGLIEVLSGMGKVTKADVIKALQDNPPVKLEEVVLGVKNPTRVEGRSLSDASIAEDRRILEDAGIYPDLHPDSPDLLAFLNSADGDMVSAGELRQFVLDPEYPEVTQQVAQAAQNISDYYLGAESSKIGPARYGRYTLPGGENYREMLLTLPSKRPSIQNMGRREYDEAVRRADEQGIRDYTSPHWDQPNVLAHARISDRTGPNGEKILHVEEVQSDWHQVGRKRGYEKSLSAMPEMSADELLLTHGDQLTANQKSWLRSFTDRWETAADELEIEKLTSEYDKWLASEKLQGVPDAPFKKNWHELMMRRLVDYAAKNGYDRIAITPGAEQAARYDLSKQVDKIEWKPAGKENRATISIQTGNGVTTAMFDTKTGQFPKFESGAFGGSRLDEVVGKELADKILAETSGTLSGEGLRVGGEGMKGFYDKILPTYLNELGKPYGVKVGQMEIEGGSEMSRGPTGRSMVPTYTPKTVSVHSFDITPQMREAIKSKGLPLYAKGGSVRISDSPDTMALELAIGGAVKGAKAAKEAAKAAEKAVPPKLPRAEPKTKAEIEAIAQRMAPQLTGEYVRKSPESAITVAGKTKKQFEREKDLPVELTGEAKAPAPVDIESLKGKAMMGILGDPSITGRELMSVGETRLASPAPQHGGPLYGMGREDEAFWASGKGAAQKVQNLADEISKQYGADVLGKYIMMGPEGLNYAQHFADANLQAIDLSKMTKKQVEQFDRMIRKGSPNSGPRPSFPGIEDKEGAYLHLAFDPELRKHFNALMQMPTVTEAFNLPSGQDIRFAITEPLLRDLERGVSGMSIGEMRPGRELTRSSHPTYEMDIPGKFLGSSKYPVPYELMFPDTVKAIRENPRQAPHEFGSLGMVGPRQIIDQQMIDELKAYEEQIRKLTGKKKGGAVRKADGGEVTIPDMSDGGKIIDGGPFKKGGKVRITNNLDTMRLAVQKRK